MLKTILHTAEEDSLRKKKFGRETFYCNGEGTYSTPYVGAKNTELVYLIFILDRYFMLRAGKMDF